MKITAPARSARAVSLEAFVDNLNLANVVIYARYSSAGQNDQSIDGQLAKCREYAQQRGYRVVGEYCDRALSGRYAETRPEFQRMISDSAKHAFDFVLVWKLDRFSRDRYDSAIYKKKLRANGVRVLSVTEGVGDSSESVLLEAILEAMAEEYSRQLAQNVRRGMRQNAEKGLSLGGLPPLGYHVVNKQYEINEDEARIVRFIHEQYADGAGQKQIVADCARLGYRNQRGNPLTLASVKRILANERYVGRYDYLGEIVIEDAFPAIVSKELKKRVRDRLKANAKAPGHAKAKVEYLLHGKLFCGECGAHGSDRHCRRNRRSDVSSCRLVVLAEAAQQIAEPAVCQTQRGAADAKAQCSPRESLACVFHKKYLRKVVNRPVSILSLPDPRFFWGTFMGHLCTNFFIFFCISLLTFAPNGRIIRP